MVDRLHRARGDPPAAGLRVVDLDTVLTQHRHGHVEVGLGRDRLPVVDDVDAAVEAGAGEQQGGDELARAGGVEHDLPARHATGADAR